MSTPSLYWLTTPNHVRIPQRILDAEQIAIAVVIVERRELVAGVLDLLHFVEGRVVRHRQKRAVRILNLRQVLRPIERSICPQAASLWYKIIDARSQQRSTALVTNIDFEAWADYLGDAPLAMALLDRVVDGATIVKLKGKSYRAQRGPDKQSAP